MPHQLPDLYALSPLQIQQLIDDLRLVKDENAKIFFAIDPYELMSFCFPVHLSDDPDADVDIKALADDQAALYEIFYRQNALLLSEYDHELDRSLYFFEHTTDRFRDKAKMVDRIIEQGERIWGTFPEGDIDENADFLKKNFSIILAIAMGTFSVGIIRLRDIYDLRLIKGDITRRVQPADLPEVRRILSGYQRTEYWDVIKTQLSQPFWDEDDKKRQLRSVEVDASAIDRIIYLNSSFEEARLRGDLSTRYLFVYLSSARRTARVFTHESANRFLPIVNGAPYNFWRTRQQIFAYVVHKSREENPGESIANLERVRDILDEVNKFEGLFSANSCVDCVLKTGIAPGSTHETALSDCRLRDFCTKVKGLDDEIQRARTQVQNLGLINTLHDYDRLRGAKPAGDSQKQYLDFFRKTFTSPLARQARAKMKRLQQWILVKSEFATSFSNALGISRPDFDHSSLRSPEDFVTGSGQYLPTKPKLLGKSYQEILQSILSFYRDPTNFDHVESAYKRYVELDTVNKDVDKEMDLEHELIRCFLYLALPRNTQNTEPVVSPAPPGDQKAYEHAESLMESDQLIDRADWNNASEAIKQEFRYVQCWAARRTGHFRKAVTLAKEGIEKEPSDPRFFHGLCLAIYSWLVTKAEDGPPQIEEAIEATKTAISLYKAQSTSHENDDVIAANYNNLTYFLAWSIELTQKTTAGSQRGVAEQDRQAVAQAREALEALRLLVDKSTWERTKHPEYFHTEAYLEYVESTVAIADGDFAKACRKLENANREIGIAIPLLSEGPTKDNYRELRDRIQRALKMLKS
jgi:hypothetical protein